MAIDKKSARKIVIPNKVRNLVVIGLDPSPDTKLWRAQDEESIKNLRYEEQYKKIR